MNAVQIMTGRGGWPMSVFLTPDLKPFYGGTYWPPEPRLGMPGFEQVLVAVDDAWRNRREAALKQAEEMTGYLKTIEHGEDDGKPVVAVDKKSVAGVSETAARQLLENAERALRRAFDSRHGGFGGAPKFPHSMDLQLLLRLWKRKPRQDLLEIVTVTLDKMAAGGIYDHLAGGFARYSVDERWLVPHFEKMLYDNALLTSAYLEAFQATGEERFARIAREICDYMLRYMTDPAGGFHGTEDADSEGEEGKFYVWTPAEVKAILGEKAGDRFCYVYDVTDEGNFEHKQSILNLPKSIEQCAALRKWDVTELKAELADSRAKLLAVRDQRIRPGKDDKVLAGWNGLMIAAMAQAGVLLAEPRFTAAAEKAANFISAKMLAGGRLQHTWRQGQAKLAAYLDDYAYLASAFITLYESTFDERWIDIAVSLADSLLQHFQDTEQGGFFFTADDHEQLIARNKDLHDASVPSGNAMAATALIRLGKLTGRTDFLEAAGRTLAMASAVMERTPTGAGQMLIALDFWLGPVQELVLLGGQNENENREALLAVRKNYQPRSVTAYRVAKSAKTARSAALEPLFQGRTAFDDQPTLYVCEDFACQAPLVGIAAISASVANTA
jgi:uncharacterized protein